MIDVDIVKASPTIPVIIKDNIMAMLDGNLTFEGANLGGNWSTAGTPPLQGNLYLNDTSPYVVIHKFNHRLFNISQDGNWSFEFKIKLLNFQNGFNILTLYNANVSANATSTGNTVLFGINDNGNLVMKNRLGQQQCNYNTIFGEWARMK